MADTNRMPQHEQREHIDTPLTYDLELGAAAERAAHPKREAVITLFQRADGKVLLLRTRKLPGSWQPVGGGLEPTDTSFSAAAVREIHEELGIQVDETNLTHIIDVPYDFGEGSIHCYTATWPTDAGEPVVAENEIMETSWFTPDQAQNLPAFPATKTFLTHLYT